MQSVPSKNTRCKFGIAVREVTPPVGVYARWWGAAKHDVAEGVHRPLRTSAAIIAPVAGDGPTLAIVAVDNCCFQYADDERAMRAAIQRRAGLGEEAVLLTMSHAHSTANINTSVTDKPGSGLAAAYLTTLIEAACDAVDEATQNLSPAWITYGIGRCSLAANRDYWDEAEGRFSCGLNPDAPADDTVLVARVTGDDGVVRAILFNYACHPTTLAWDNRLLSSDYVGAAREIVEEAFGAPALFMQGASGDLGPREGFVGDTAVADRNGRQLGYAVASAVEALPPPASAYVYTGIVKSGADIGTWAWQLLDDAALAGSGRLEARMVSVAVKVKPIPSEAELRAEIAACTDRVEDEKLQRRLNLRRSLGAGDTHTIPLWVWRLGDAALVAVPEEPYSVLQEELRRRFPEIPLLVLTITNGALAYLCPRAVYGSNRYQEVQSPYQPGCLEATIDALADGVAALFRE